MKPNLTHFIRTFVLICVGTLGALNAGEKGIATHTKTDKSLPVYVRTLSAIMAEEETNAGQCLVLDDGSAWVVKGFAHGSQSDLKNWTKGDRIAFLWNAKTKEGYYIAYNHEHTGQPQVLLDVKTIDVYPYIVKVIDKGTKIKLNDHSIWKITWYGRASTTKWKEGQHVLIQGEGNKNNYSITNLNAEGELFKDHKHAYASFEEFQY